MKKSDLQFDLPKDLIAQEPSRQRDRCRLMVLDRSSRTIEHKVFADLAKLLRPGDLLVLNRSKVLAARFEARRRSGGVVRGLFLRELGIATWEVLLQSKGRLHTGDQLLLADGTWFMNLLQRGERGLWAVQVFPPSPSGEVLDEIGQVPLPPYIRRKDRDARAAKDREWYQTVYASEPGSVAAPTAGLHFTDGLLHRVTDAGAGLAWITLHVGLGTFQQIEADDLARHKMHAEYYDLPAETADKVNRTRASDARAAGGTLRGTLGAMPGAPSERSESRGDGHAFRQGPPEPWLAGTAPSPELSPTRGRVIAVGTTCVRVLETGSDDAGRLTPQTGSTDIFLYPPYRFKCVDAMITNFHLPGSTLLALVFALAGRDFILQAYEQAVRQQYRFFSYGDAMMIV